MKEEAKNSLLDARYFCYICVYSVGITVLGTIKSKVIVFIILTGILAWSLIAVLFISNALKIEGETVGLFEISGEYKRLKKILFALGMLSFIGSLIVYILV